MTSPRVRSSRPSLRRRLLLLLLVPMGILLLLDALLSYGVALTYSNRVHDQDLREDAQSLATMVSNRQPGDELSPQARFLLEYDPQGRSYFSVRSRLHGLLAGNEALPQTAQIPPLGARPTLYDTKLAKRPLRAATVQVAATQDPGDSLIITFAETLHDRHQQARDILLLATVMQTLLIICVLSLVWFGVGRGLRVLDPLTARLAARSHELTPLDPLQRLPGLPAVLFAQSLLLHAAQCGFHLGHALQHGLPVRQHAGLQLMIPGVLGGQADAPVEQRDAYFRSERVDRIRRAGFSVIVVDVGGKVDRAAEADAGKPVGVGCRQLAGGGQYLGFGAGYLRPAAQQVGRGVVDFPLAQFG